MNRSWLLTIIAAVFEVVWVTGLKHAHDILTWTITIVAIATSFSMLIIASIKLPVGTVYAVFTGLGTAGTVVTEMTLFDEPVQVTKILLIAMLLLGVIGLKMIGSRTDGKEAGR